MRFVYRGKAYDDLNEPAVFEAPYHGARGFDKASLHKTAKGTLFMCVGLSEHATIRRFYSADTTYIHQFLEESKAPANVYDEAGITLEEV